MPYQNLNKRVTTALVLSSVVVLILIWSAFSCNGKLVMFFTAFVAVAFCAFEGASICSRDKRLSLKLPAYFLLSLFPTFIPVLFVYARGICSFDSVALSTIALSSVASCVLPFSLAMFYSAFHARKTLDEADSIAREIFILIFLVGFCGTLLLNLLLLEGSHLILIWLLLVVCSNDIAAYFVGSKLQGPRLAPLVSPNKTISGSVGGLAAGVLLGVGGMFLLPKELDLISSLLMSVIVVLCAQSGDLGKSYLKRLYGVKDSGTILPGHGGILDRIDGILPGAALLYFWLTL